MREIVGQVNIPRDPEEVRSELFDWLVDHDVHPEYNGEALTFEPPVFLPNWSLFVGATAGRILVKQTESGCSVHYEISLGYLRFFALCLTVISIAVAWANRDLKFFYIGLAVAWIWIYGLGFLLTRSRLRKFFSSLPAKPYATKVRG